MVLSVGPVESTDADLSSLARQNSRRPALRAGCGQDARVPSVRPMTGARTGSRVARVAPHGFPGQMFPGEIVLPR